MVCLFPPDREPNRRLSLELNPLNHEIYGSAGMRRRIANQVLSGWIALSRHANDVCYGVLETFNVHDNSTFGCRCPCALGTGGRHDDEHASVDPAVAWHQDGRSVWRLRENQILRRSRCSLAQRREQQSAHNPNGGNHRNQNASVCSRHGSSPDLAASSRSALSERAALGHKAPGERMRYSVLSGAATDLSSQEDPRIRFVRLAPSRIVSK